MERFMSAAEFFIAYKPFLIAFAVMVVLVFALMLLLQYARRQAEEELNTLFNCDVNLYLERLDNNGRLSLVFRKPVLLLYKLRGYLKTGNDSEIRGIITKLDGMKLEPRDRVEYLQNRMSFFVSVGETAEAKTSFERLRGYLRSVHADEVEKYRDIINEGEEIIRVYLDRDISYMYELKHKAETAEHPVMRGVMYFRLAKLAHFKGSAEERENYLALAAETLSGTDYEEIITEAFKTPEILEIK
jgi:hypothetical protein